MTRLIINGLPSSLEGSKRLRLLTEQLLPEAMADVEGACILAPQVRTYTPIELNEHEQPRLLVTLPGFFRKPERTGVVLQELADAIADCIWLSVLDEEELDQCGVLEVYIESVDSLTGFAYALRERDLVNHTQ